MITSKSESFHRENRHKQSQDNLRETSPPIVSEGREPTSVKPPQKKASSPAQGPRGHTRFCHSPRGRGGPGEKGRREGRARRSEGARQRPVGVASRGSGAESLKLQSEPSNFPSRNGGRLAARRDHKCMGPSTGPGVVWEGRPPPTPEAQQASAGPPRPRSPARRHDRAQPCGGRPRPHKGEAHVRGLRPGAGVARRAGFRLK